MKSNAIQTLVSTIIWSLYFSAPLMGQQNCSYALVKDTVSEQTDDRVRFSILKIIDREQFDMHKRDGGAGANLLIDGVPLSGYASYEEFDTARRREYSRYEFNYSASHVRSFLTSKLSNNALAAYLGCLKAGGPLEVYPVRFSDENVTVAFEWRPQAPVRSGTVTNKTLIGSTSAPTTIPNSFAINSAIERTFSRNPKKEFEVGVEVLNSHSKSFRIDPEPKVTMKEAPKCIAPTWNDPGYVPTRSLRDHNGDGCLDYCRLVGNDNNFTISCDFGSHLGSAPIPAFNSAPVDISKGHAVWTDIDRDGVIDICAIGTSGGQRHIVCRSFNGSALGSPKTLTTRPVVDTGYEGTWIAFDVNGDAFPEICRTVGGPVTKCYMNQSGRALNGAENP